MHRKKIVLIGGTRRKQGATQTLHANSTSPEFRQPFPTDSNRDKEIAVAIVTFIAANFRPHSRQTQLALPKGHLCNMPRGQEPVNKQILILINISSDICLETWGSSTGTFFLFWSSILTLFYTLWHLIITECFIV